MSMISFARGVPAPECLPVEALAECAKAAIERDGRTILSYGTGGGYGPLREWIAARHGVTPEAARRRRIPPAVAARHEWIRLLRDTWALTPSETARMVGMDYATVQYALGWRR